jgi:hemerythrin
MAFMQWDDSFSVNVKEIDQQHQKLVGMLNEFYGHVGKDAGQAFRLLLDSLVDYTQYHFSTEEKYFKAFSYPEAATHTEEHQKFTEKVLDVKNRLYNKELVLSLEITVFLREWLTHHIKGSDKAYGRFFNDNGLF